uniref:Putative secreted protein n=1 Tax=Anopheles darlingi TaxID=43151 RepID=A0A2M4DN44_ANODA
MFAVALLTLASVLPATTVPRPLGTIIAIACLLHLTRRFGRLFLCKQRSKCNDGFGKSSWKRKRKKKGAAINNAALVTYPAPTGAFGRSLAKRIVLRDCLLV